MLGHDSRNWKIRNTGMYRETFRLTLKLYPYVVAVILVSFIAIVFSANAHAETSKWEQLENIPDCRVWNEVPTPDNSVTWTGICRNGHTEGEGELVWHEPRKDGSVEHVYIGHMVHGKLHGYGIYTWPDGSRYDGMWSGDNRHGIGTAFDSFGNAYYKGDWIGDVKSGYGVETIHCSPNLPKDFLSQVWQSYICGLTYDGEWKAGLPNGKGTLITRYLGSYSGHWTNGCLNKYYFLNLTFGVNRRACK